MKIFVFILTGLVFLLSAANVHASSVIVDLAGKWRFQIDRSDVGVVERWFDKQLTDVITLPGSMTENMKGDEVTLHTPWTASIYDSTFFFNPRLERFRTADNLKLPFWLTPVKYYVGAAWYQKDVEINQNIDGKRICLFLERPHTESRVWINGSEVGMQNSLSVPHQFEVSGLLKQGKNTITIRVDNRTKDIDVGKDSHSITDHTQGNWNGIVGRMELRETAKSYIADAKIYPDLKNRKAKVSLLLKGKSSGTVTLSAESFNSEKLHRVPSVTKPYSMAGDTLLMEMELPFGKGMLLWDEFNPNLYNLKITIKNQLGDDEKVVQVGMRDFSIEGKYFYVNGRKTMLRGTVENCVFPLTGYAPMDVESWERVFRICRNYGLNHMRFHSYCPPEAAFIAADRVGFYLQPEGPSWPNHGSSLGDGRPVDNYLWNEAIRIVDYYGNYPSFCMFAIGNEPRGRWVAWVSKFVDFWKIKDSRRVYTGASVGGSWAWQPKNQFHVKAGARGLAWNKRPESLSDYRDKIDTVSQPYVSHETGQWCVFPDFTETKKYTGVMRARNFELFQDDLNERGMGDLAPDFLMASGKLQALCYKHEIEKTLRTPGYAGFQLLSLNDYTGQGTALVGVLNAFWQEKGYVDSNQFSDFCAPTVLLARFDKFVFTRDEKFKANIEVSHFGIRPLKGVKTKWSILDESGKMLANGVLPAKDIPIGNCNDLGSVSIPLNRIEQMGKLTLRTEFAEAGISNEWNFWVYPSAVPDVETSSIHICHKIDQKAEQVLNDGGKVLLLLAGKVTMGKDVVQHLTPAFWNTSWFKMRPPHTVGLLINDFHPIFGDFSTDYYSNLQWWELVYSQQVMEMADLPRNLRPIIQPIDTWFINRKLGMLFEAKVGNGKLVVCSADIESNLNERIVARQLRYSILNYMNSIRFNPEQSVDLTSIANLSVKSGETLDFTTKDAPDELKTK